MGVLEDWDAHHLERYLEEHAAGKHDAECERRERSYICHCNKRRREAEGRTTPPTLEFSYPTCTGCWKEVEGDGDTFSCPRCHASWPADAGWDTPGEFYDDYGPQDGDIGWGGEQFGRLLREIVEEV